jgi:hypothetical protein
LASANRAVIYQHAPAFGLRFQRSAIGLAESRLEIGLAASNCFDEA